MPSRLSVSVIQPRRLSSCSGTVSRSVAIRVMGFTDGRPMRTFRNR